MSFDAVIATYNRPEKVTGLVKTLLACEPVFDKVVVVDSSDEVNNALMGNERIEYVRSNHKNQPYQRYLGYLKAQSEFIVFFDDDMEIVHPTFLGLFQKVFEDESVVGIQPKMKNLHDDATIKIESSLLAKLWQKDNFLVNGLRWLTMYPRLPNGKWWYCGLRGPKPENKECNLEWVSGWAFAARRSAMFQNFNFQLFDLFEQKMGMGEDLLLGHLLSKVGTVKYIPTLLFLHNDQRSSTYTADHFSFGRRTVYSRLFLSLEYARLNQKSFGVAKAIYMYYSLVRTCGFAFNYTIKRNSNTKKLIQGYIAGFKLSLKFRYDSGNTIKAYWESELKKISD